MITDPVMNPERITFQPARAMSFYSADLNTMHKGLFISKCKR